jgi:hypothetical protein
MDVLSGHHPPSSQCFTTRHALLFVCQDLQFLMHVIIVKTKAILSQTYVTMVHVVYPSVFLFPKNFELFSFEIVWLWAYLVKIILETCSTH